MNQRHARNNFPKLHNAMWPGLVGKGTPGAEPFIDLDTMLDLTAKAEVDGIRFEGVDLFLFEPHINIDIDEDGLKHLADKVRSKGFVVGSVVAPVWLPTGGGSAMGSEEDRKKFVEQVRKGCRIARKLRDLGARPYGVVRIDSASGVADWTQDREGNQAMIAQTFREACDVAESFGERLAGEGEICWGGMHSWRKMLDLLERVNRPQTLGFQADMAHTLLYTMGYNAPEDALLPAEWDWSDPAKLDNALKQLTAALRPWTIDFHVAQNDATVHGSGTHDKTGHHCLPNDPSGKLRIAHHAGFWLREDSGRLTRRIRHICWDGCMFPNAVMMQQQTWNDILSAMIAVRDAHGWQEPVPMPPGKPVAATGVIPHVKPRPAARPKAKPPKKSRRVAKVGALKVKSKKKAERLSVKTRKPMPKQMKKKAAKKTTAKAKAKKGKKGKK